MAILSCGVSGNDNSIHISDNFLILVEHKMKIDLSGNGSLRGSGWQRRFWF